MKYGTFGVWLKRYKGTNARVQQVRDWFLDRVRQNSWKPSDFKTADSVWCDLYHHDCPPDWVPEILIACDRLMKSGRADFSEAEQLEMARVELAKP